MPFAAWSLYLEDSSYTLSSAVWSAFCFVQLGPYTGPLLIQGFLKLSLAKARPRRTWGRREQGILLLTSTVPSLMWLYTQWATAAPAWPVLAALTLVYFVYFFETVGHHPETTGCRDWPAFREASCCSHPHHPVSHPLDAVELVAAEQI